MSGLRLFSFITTLGLATSACADVAAVPDDVAAQMGQILGQCLSDPDCLTFEAQMYCGDAIGADDGAPTLWLMCQDVELSWWDGQLNAAYQGLMAEKKMLDAGGDGTRYGDYLRDMQRAWIGFRDRRCDFLAHGNGPTGSGAVNDTLDCMIEMTAEQTMFLRSNRSQ